MSEKKDESPFDDIYTNVVSQIDPIELAALVKPYLRINRESGQVMFTSDGLRLATTKKIALFFLARKIMHIREEISEEMISPKELKQALGGNVPSGTVDATLKRLSDKGPVKRIEGKYFVPDFNFQHAREMLTKDGSE